MFLTAAGGPSKMMILRGQYLANFSSSALPPSGDDDSVGSLSALDPGDTTGVECLQPISSLSTRNLCVCVSSVYYFLLFCDALGLA